MRGKVVADSACGCCEGYGGERGAVRFVLGEADECC